MVAQPRFGLSLFYELMPVLKKKNTRVLAAGPKACLEALRALAAVGAASGDSYTALRNPSLWPRDTHDAVNAAWSSLSNEGSGFEVPAHVISAALDAIRGLRLVPGFKVRLPTDPNGEGHPTFIKGSGRNPAFLRLRDFTDSLVMCAEATLSRDAAAAPLAKGKCKLPEQRALRQHLGLPLSSAAQRARLRARDFGSMLADGGVPLPPATVAQLVSLIGGPLPEVPALARSASQPVPYLEAERLLLCTLPKAALDAVLKTDVGATAIARAQQARRLEKPPLPDWYGRYMVAAQEAESSDATTVSAAAAELALRGGSAYEFARSAALPEEARPAAEMEASKLERFWFGLHEGSGGGTAAVDGTDDSTLRPRRL